MAQRTDALDREGEGHGWLFPRTEPDRDKWLDRVGKHGEKARAAADWPWTFHWLRHAHASVSLAPVAYGGFDLDPVSVSVSRRLGHAKTSTTQDMYLVPQPDDAATTRRLTGRPPGQRVRNMVDPAD